MKYRIFTKEETEYINSYKNDLVSEMNKIGCEMCEDANFIIILGGDGSILRVVDEEYSTNATLFVINFGNLGYHSTVDKISPCLVACIIKNREFYVCSYDIYSIQYDNTNVYFINEVVFNSKRYLKDFEIIYGDTQASYNASKVILSTKFGSTGYVWYNNGAIIDETLNYYQVVPVGSINNRVINGLDKNLIINDSKKVVCNANNIDYLNVDYRIVDLNGRYKFVIEKTDFKFNLCKLQSEKIYNDKLM